MGGVVAPREIDLTTPGASPSLATLAKRILSVPATPSFTNRELCARIWTRLRPYRGRLFLSLGLLVFSVPFVNFHPLVWGYVADGLVQKTLTPSGLGSGSR